MRKVLAMFTIAIALHSAVAAASSAESVLTDYACILDQLFSGQTLNTAASQLDKAVETCITVNSGMVQQSMLMHEIREHNKLEASSPEVAWRISNVKAAMHVGMPIVLSRCADTTSTQECLALLQQ